MLSHFQMFAHYNTLANQRLYAACAQLSEAERQQQRPAFFKSIHGTLNHILVGDRIWLARFQGSTIASTGLDHILYEVFDSLQTARQQEDDRIETFVASLTDADLQTTIAYTNNQGKPFSDPFPLLLAHFFNHQTHHRGQLHDLLTQTSVAPPVLDLHRVLQPG